MAQTLDPGALSRRLGCHARRISAGLSSVWSTRGAVTAIPVSLLRGHRRTRIVRSLAYCFVVVVVAYSAPFSQWPTHAILG